MALAAWLGPLWGAIGVQNNRQWWREGVGNPHVADWANRPLFQTGRFPGMWETIGRCHWVDVTC